MAGWPRMCGLPETNSCLVWSLGNHFLGAGARLVESQRQPSPPFNVLAAAFANLDVGLLGTRGSASTSLGGNIAARCHLPLRAAAGLATQPRSSHGGARRRGGVAQTPFVAESGGARRGRRGHLLRRKASQPLFPNANAPARLRSSRRKEARNSKRKAENRND